MILVATSNTLLIVSGKNIEGLVMGFYSLTQSTVPMRISVKD